MGRRLAAPHVLLTAYCAGLLCSLLMRPTAWMLGLAASMSALAGLGMWLVLDRAQGVQACAKPRSDEDAARDAYTPASSGETEARRTHRSAVAVFTLALLLLIAGVGAGGLRLAAMERSSLAAHVGQRVTLRGVLTDLPDIAEKQVTLALRVSAADGEPMDEPVHLRLSLDERRRLRHDPSGPLSEGALVEVRSVHVRPLPDPKLGAFDYGRYLRRRGEHVLLEAEFPGLTVTGRRDGVRGAIDGLRRASRAHLQEGLRSPVRDVLQGMVLGDDEGVDEQLIDDFRRSGLLHIMAVSGENVVLLCSMWTFVFTLLAIPRLVRTALLMPVVATYVLLTGASPSIVRAGVSGIVALLAIMASRPSDGWLLWLAPGAWLLTANPNNLFDVSFQLSFGAVAGLLVLAQPLTRAVGFLPGPLPEQVGVTMAASLSTAPVSMLAFGSASLVSIPANVAGGFVLGPIMFLGMLSLLLGFISSWLATPLNLVAGLFIGFLLEVAGFFGRLPWAVYEWHGPSLALLLTVAGAVLAAGVWLLAGRADEGPLAYVRKRLTPIITVTGFAFAVMLLLTPAGPAAPSRTTLTFLDVGEGASTLLQVPSGPTVLVDAGPAPLARTLREHGVRRVDLLVLSHGHSDHTMGLQDVIGRVSIGTALLPRPPEPDAALERLTAQLLASGADVQRCERPVSLTGEGWGMVILPTKASASGSGNQGENDNALVVVTDLHGRRVLLPGDAEGDVLRRLGLPLCDVVGVPHHGSAGGFDAELLAILAPRLAVIPVGPNRHGHPTDEAIDLLTGAGVPYVRTDRHGDVAVTTDDDGLKVRVDRQ